MAQKTYRCSCGDKVTFFGSPVTIHNAYAFWKLDHKGDGHKLVTAQAFKKIKGQKHELPR